MGTEKKKKHSIAEVQVIFIFIHQGSSFSLSPCRQRTSDGGLDLHAILSDGASQSLEEPMLPEVTRVAQSNAEISLRFQPETVFVERREI